MSRVKASQGHPRPAIANHLPGIRVVPAKGQQSHSSGLQLTSHMSKHSQEQPNPDQPDPTDLGADSMFTVLCPGSLEGLVKHHKHGDRCLRKGLALHDLLHPLLGKECGMGRHPHLKGENTVIPTA